MSKYDIFGPQDRFEPGSKNRVLENRLGITDPAELDEAELVLLQKLYQEVLVRNLPTGVIRVETLKNWHRRWLGNLFDWAGEERSVNMSKGGFPFANAVQVPRLLQVFERDCLARYTPCSGMEEPQLVEAIAVTHVEFILIHPFREGNGRLSRLLADVMAVQAGHQPLDYSSWDSQRDLYIAAIQQGVACDYEPIRGCVAMALRSDTDEA